MKPKVAISTTTIRVPTFLRELCENAASHEWRNIICFVIGDTKTPAESRQFCRALSNEFGIAIEYLDIEDQEKALAEHTKLLKLIPLNSGSRKMIGNFLAYLKGCDLLIMIDDDNFITAGDFIRSHSIVGTKAQLDLIRSETGWFNVCESVIEERGVPFYPRGYPWSQRTPTPPKTVRRSSLSKVIMNQGFVLDDPDIDAISRLFWPIRVTAMDVEFEPHFGLCPGTWSPFNNQNTAICRDAIPVYFASPSTGRNADIWGSYVMCRLVEHMGDVITFGHPLVRQLRNPHNLWKDLDDENLNNRATDRFVSLLRGIRLTKKTYMSALKELLCVCLDEIAKEDGPIDEEMNMMRDFFLEYQSWLGLFAG